MKEEWKQSSILKMICFFLLPIIGAMIFVSCFSICYVAEYPEVRNTSSYFETEAFTDIYKGRLSMCSREMEEVKDDLFRHYDDLAYIESIDSQYVQTDGKNAIYYRPQYTNMGNHSNFFQYLVYDPVSKEAYTNLEKTAKTDTVEKIKETILANPYIWSYQDKKVTTNIKSMALEDLKYKGSFNEIEENQYEIYSGMNSNWENGNGFFQEELIFNVFRNLYHASYYVLPISAVLGMILAIYLWIACGHRKEHKEIYLNGVDRIPLGVLGIVASIIYTIEFAFAILFASIISLDDLAMITPWILIVYLICLTSLYLFGSILKRCKSHTLFKNTILYHLYGFLKNKLVKLYQEMIANFNVTSKLAILYFGFILASVIILFVTLGLGFGFFSMLLLLAFWIGTFRYLVKRMNELNKIKEALHHIYEGKVDVQLKEEELEGVLKEMAIYVNDIAGGFSKAVEESLKSERLKTELITNVSHDIKTPLTSIINYIDLLKQEKIESKRAKEYLEVLDNKSQRLKKLIEDLVEASKASSGNIKLTIEKLNMKELIKQVTGEFEDKFKKKGLETIFEFPEGEIYIDADSRYLYRVIENMYSNIAKYALENSRVYVDVVQNGSKILVAIKNISKEKLNISAEELMQRFVRGDSSRNTEGSGLGLSIARSLTELQGGKFNLYLDGDLFKVTIELERSKL